jgi:porphobilinogen synthase
VPHTRFPLSRKRRLRSDEWSRNLFAENVLTASDFVLPVFIIEGTGVEQSIPTMPGIKKRSMDFLMPYIEEIVSSGVTAIVLFPTISCSKKSNNAEESYNKNGLIQTAIKTIKNKFSDLCIITDVALDPYTINGHDGISKNNLILNDETIEVLKKQSLSHAEAGADIIAPSDMMDGRILGIRQELEKNLFINTKILSYSAKYASSYYGPFRDAVCSNNSDITIDKRTYQMDIANSNEAIFEAKMDIEEGADIVMVKPGSLYLDILYRIKKELQFPTAIYHVSGEYSMLKLGVENGIIDEKQAVLEAMLSFKRAGADIIFTYYADKICKWIS